MCLTIILDIVCSLVLDVGISSSHFFTACQNNCKCDWDGGDCCAKSNNGSVNTKYCKVSRTHVKRFVRALLLRLSDILLPTTIASVCRHVNVWTRITKAIVTAKACANSRTTKGMAIATTKTSEGLHDIEF